MTIFFFKIPHGLTKSSVDSVSSCHIAAQTSAKSHPAEPSSLSERGVNIVGANAMTASRHLFFFLLQRLC